jgi:hypothetical protein
MAADPILPTIINSDQILDSAVIMVVALKAVIMVVALEAVIMVVALEAVIIIDDDHELHFNTLKSLFV